jgi:serine/threonine-protein kinase
MRITLSVTEGPHTGRAFSFDQHDTFIVGRSVRAHFRLAGKDKFFSRFHFLVEINPPQCRLVDLGSRNGTRVNGRKVTQTDLHDGDQIKGGQTVLRVSFEGATPPPETRVDTEKVAVPRPVPAASPPPLPERRRPAAQPAARPAPPPLPPALAPPTCLSCGTTLSAYRTLNPRDLALCGSCLQEADRQAQPIPGYRIVRPLGSGAMGVVHLAARVADGSVVALKTIRSSGATKEDEERFLREANILRALEHPNIVSFRDMGSAAGQLFFAMDYVAGSDACALLKEHGPLPIRRAVRLVGQILEALEYAHGKGFVHRDIKPANVLVAGSDGRDVAKVADFGLARVYQASTLSGLTVVGALGGTPPFMPPEQITNYREAMPAADQYSTAAMLYNLLTGQYVFDMPRRKHELFRMILSDPPVPIRSRRPEVPEGLAEAIHRALAKEATERFADVGALRRALLPFAGAGR